VSARLFPRVSAQSDLQADRWLKVRNHIRELHSFLSHAETAVAPRAAQPAHATPPASAASTATLQVAEERRRLLDRYLDEMVRASSRMQLALPGVDATVELPFRLSTLYTTLALARSSDGEQPGTVFAGLRQSRHLILIGPDGAGKSTTVNQIAATMAEAIREPSRQLGLLQRLDGWGRGPRLPLRVQLADCVACEATEPLDLLWNGVAELRSLALNTWEHKLLRDTLSHTLERGQGILLLDGLDQVEAGVASERAHAVIVAARARFSASHILATFRSDDYDCHAYRLNEIDSAVLAPFSPRDVEAFIARWYRELANQGRYSAEVAQERARSLALAIRANGRLQRHAGLPQNLAAMALVHSHGADLPGATIKQFWLGM
jgi:predicted NACHT family NTPase